MRVGIAADHAGYSLKQELVPSLGREIEDLGTHGPEPVDYPGRGRSTGPGGAVRYGGAGCADLRERSGSLGGGEQVPWHPRGPLP
jgi:hypothetical protein